MVQMNGLGGRHRTLGLQLAKTQALLYDKYHYVLHNVWVLIACSHKHKQSFKIKYKYNKKKSNMETFRNV